MINNTKQPNVYSQFLDIKKYPSFVFPCNNQNSAIASTTLKEEEEEKKESNNALTKAVASVAIIGGITGFVFARNSSFSKKINRWIQRLDDEIYKYRNEKLGFLEKIYDKTNKGLRKIFEWLGIINNFAAAKDVGFKKLCEKLKLKKPIDWITNQFKKITIATSRRSYENARNITDNNIAELKNIIANIKDPKVKAQITNLENALADLENKIFTFTTATSRNNRLQNIEKYTANLGDEVEKEMKHILSNFKTEYEKLRLYRTEVHAAESKEKIVAKLNEVRRAVSFNIDDIVKISNECCDIVGSAIKFEDRTSKDTLRELRKLIKKYSAVSGEKEQAQRATIVPLIKDKIKELQISTQAYGKYSEKTQELFNTQFSELISAIKNTEKKGAVEEILKILKNENFQTTDPKTYWAIRNLATQIRNATNKAFDNEIKLYDKFAEYSVGSAPTDVAAIMFPLALALGTVIKGENKDEKISATLKAGIPIFGGVISSFIATAKMWTNMQGILIGTLTGILLNALGSKADETYKQYQEKNLFAQKAIAAYRQNNPQTNQA